MKKNNGFTLVELLTTIAIIGILSVIAVSSVIKIGNSINEREYNSKIELLSTAAELYAQDNQEIFGVPTEDCEMVASNEACVRVEELIQNNYAEIDVNKGDKCDDDFGCVINPVDDSSLNEKYFLVRKLKNRSDAEFLGKPLIKYTLTINLSGGEWEGENGEIQKSLSTGEEIRMEDAVKENCTFKNWEIVGDGTVNNKKYTMGKGNTTLTAKYDCENKLIVDKNGGIWNGEETQYLDAGATTTIENPTKENCIFSKWNITKGTGTISSTTSSTTFTMGDADSTIRAEYQCTLENIIYSGSYRAFSITETKDYVIELWGASGAPFAYAQSFPGKGGYTKGTISLNTGDILYFYVGGEGNKDLGHNAGCRAGAGGWNGGASGGEADGGENNNTCYSGNDPGAGGGGATDVRLTKTSSLTAWDETTSLRSRIMVAGAGGTRGANDTYGHGGGLIGYGTDCSSAYVQQKSTGGTQTSGGLSNVIRNWYGPQGCNGSDGGASGTFGKGGTGQKGFYYCTAVVQTGDGGAGGYYGGGGSGNRGLSGTGGGSSYISGHTGSIAVNTSGKAICSETVTDVTSYVGTTDNTCSIHYSNKTFSETVMIDGAGYSWSNKRDALVQMPNPSGGYYALGAGHTGNGYARISYIDK